MTEFIDILGFFNRTELLEMSFVCRKFNFLITNFFIHKPYKLYHKIYINNDHIELHNKLFHASCVDEALDTLSPNSFEQKISFQFDESLPTTKLLNGIKNMLTTRTQAIHHKCTITIWVNQNMENPFTDLFQLTNKLTKEHFQLFYRHHEDARVNVLTIEKN
uniref:F-box domain-containing protein n=1 Tax=Ditylenchus dipsaci TaxID=166011 RepID=A0A915E1M8_9BILA